MMKNKISLNFDDLFAQALEAWAKYVNIEEPIYEKSFEIEGKVSREYKGELSILMSNLNWKIHNALGTEKREGRLPLIKNTKNEVKRALAEALQWRIDTFKKDLQSDLDRFEEDLEWQSKNLHIKKIKGWTLWDMGLAKAYLDANKDEEESE
jgi:hypothetical protein